MGALTASGVTILASYRSGGNTGKRTLHRQLQLALTGQGGASNTIAASALGFTRIEGCSNLLDTNTHEIYPAVPSEDGLAIYLANLTQATDANRAVAADVTIEPAVIHVWGV
jgi:hypothetical protein